MTGRSLPFALCAAALSLAPAGCTLARREVMLVVTTNIPCPTIDRVAVRIYRGGEMAPTFNQTFALTGDGCSTSGNGGLRTIPLGVSSEYRLGVVDGRRSSDRVKIEVEGSGQMTIATVVETEFVDDKVYALPVQLAAQCVGYTGCASGFTCRVLSTSADAAPVCMSVYRTPGTLGRPMATSSIVADDEADLGE
ncbi:MAG: hypothetical protein U0324_04875 [Polyangiales bacterium]